MPIQDRVQSSTVIKLIPKEKSIHGS